MDEQTRLAAAELKEGQKTKLCVEERELTELGEFCRYVGVYTASELQNKPLPSAPGRSLTAAQTGLTAPFNPTNNSLLTGAFPPDSSERVLTQQGAI